MPPPPTSSVTPRLSVVRALSPADFGLELSLDGDRVVLGRDLSCSLRFDDPGVSRRHACLERLADGTWLVSDLDSTNGVFLNGRPISNARLADGDELRLGPSAIVRLVVDPSRTSTQKKGAAAPLVARWTFSFANRTITWSDSFDRLLGVEPGTFSGVPLGLDAVVGTDDCPRLLAALEQASRGAALVIEVQLRTGNRRLELRGDRQLGIFEVTTEFTGCAWDVTARYEASLRMRHHAALFESFSDSVALLDLDGKVLDCNSASLRLLGLEKEGLIGRTLDLPGNQEWTVAALERVRRLGRYEGELRLPQAAGAEMICEVVVTPLLAEDGAPMGFVAVQHDVTETRQLQGRLALTDRLSAMGTLSAGIAHEINNPLAYLRANLEHILEFVRAHARPHDPDGDLLDTVSDCAEGVERIARIVRDLKFFSRAGDDAVAPTDVSSALRLACKMSGPMLRGRAQLKVEVPELPLVRADEARLAQVVLNLLINAVQAMPERGEQHSHIAVRAQSSGDGVLIEVSDDGIGMAPEVLRRVFDPFFTTKPVGVGSGLGLSICHGIIEGFGGTISAQSKPGAGTTFRVWLMTSDEQRTPAAVVKTEAISGTPLRLLVVDDDPRVLRALTRMLGASHQVTAAHDAAGAVRLAHSGAEFDLVLCDVLMPGANGLELYQRLCAEAPALAERLVFMTGGGLPSVLQAGLEASGRAILDKPLDHARLFQVLESRARALPSPTRPSDDTLRRLRAVG